MKVLGVDPGVAGTGFAMLEATGSTIKVGMFGILRSKATRWEGRALDIAERIGGLARQAKVDSVWCELPAYWGTFNASRWAAQGSLVKQAVLAGAILGQQGCQVHLVEVNEWKGQLPKSAVEARVQECLGKQQCRGFTLHAWDAADLALWGLKQSGVTVNW